MPKHSKLATAGALTFMGFAGLLGCNAETPDEAGEEGETNETGESGDGDTGDGDGDAGDGDGDTGDGDGDTGDGDADPYDPHTCSDPSQLLGYPGLRGAFCSPLCMMDDDCPPGPAGTEASCALADEGPNAELCVLICDPANDSCPNASSCEELPENPDTGLCTYPYP
jgi:hypothetical protein